MLLRFKIWPRCVVLNSLQFHKHFRIENCFWILIWRQWKRSILIVYLTVVLLGLAGYEMVNNQWGVEVGNDHLIHPASPSRITVLLKPNNESLWMKKRKKEKEGDRKNIDYTTQRKNGRKMFPWIKLFKVQTARSACRKRRIQFYENVF